MKIKTNELTGAALDWAVAKCEGDEWDYAIGKCYSTDWAQGGPIIERKKIGFLWEHYDNELVCVARVHTPPQGEIVAEGPTPLIAAMRCHVASELGDTIDIPEELQ